MHAFVYEPTTGEATKLPVNFTDYLKGLGNVYDLYTLQNHASPAPAAPPVQQPQKQAAALEASRNDEEEKALHEFIDHFPGHTKDGRLLPGQV